MIVIHNVTIDLQDKGAVPQIVATQDDQYTRDLAISLMEGESPWEVPEDAAVVIRYCKSDGVGGEYDTLPDGTTAWSAEGNVLRIALAPQVLTVPGTVMLSATMIREAEVLSIFSVAISVRPRVQGIFGESEAFYNVAGFLPGPVAAREGQYLRIARVDDRGRVLSLEGAGILGGACGEPGEEDIPKVFFGGALPQTKIDTIMSFRYVSKTEDIRGWCKTKAQGDSSMSYPKKNQTVKLYADAECTEALNVDFRGWGKQNKFCFKANWIDLTHGRNIVSARLWGDAVKSRANYDTIPELLRTSPNQGAVDGFPVKVYADGVYQGRYTLNIPKDAWMANMDEELEEHCILCGENYESGCFRAEANIDESDWTDEVHDTVPDSILASWNEAIRFVMNSTDEEFAANIGNYFDLESLIDYYIFGMVSCGLDAFGKNQLYMTYDADKWYASMYDMDSTWGLYWDGSKFVGYNYPRSSFEDFNGRQGNLLYIRVASVFKEQIEQRWNVLKHGALSVDNILCRFERFLEIAPSSLVEEDYAFTTGEGAFTAIPLAGENNIHQLRDYIRKRHEWFCNSFSKEIVLYSDFSPNGTAFSTQTAINWNLQSVTASVDLSNAPTDDNARILLSVGQDITSWPGIACVHMYYVGATQTLRVQFFTSGGDFAYVQIPLTQMSLSLRLDKSGLTVNDSCLASAEFGSDAALYETALAQIMALDTVQIGAVEGTNKSQAVYSYIKVEGEAEELPGDTPETEDVVLYSEFAPAGTEFSKTVSMDWDTCCIEASAILPVTPDDSGAHILLSVGEDIQQWNGDKPNMHIYYMGHNNSVRVQFFAGDNQFGSQDITLDSTSLVIRLERDGLSLDGAMLTPESFGDGAEHYRNALTKLSALESVQVGAVEGANKSFAQYSYISVKTL